MSAEPVPSASSARGGRVVFVDALRLFATFQMVQGHTLDAVLATSARSGALYDLWQGARGLTAVAFLCAAGLAFQITTRERDTDHDARPGRSARRFMRALRLIGLGYLLHLPLALLWVHDDTARAAIVADFLSVDVLQCIGVALVVLELALKLLSSGRQVALAASMLGVWAFGVALVTHTLPVDTSWLALIGYVSPQGGSIFPLLPWAGHLWLGVGIGQLSAGRWCMRLVLIAAVLGAISLGLRQVSGLELIAMHTGRLSLVVLMSAGFARALRHRSRLPAWMERLAGETLTVYVFHILLVYGAGAGLASIIGPTLSLPVALVVTLLVLVASVAVALWLPAVASTWRGRGLAAPAGKR